MDRRQDGQLVERPANYLRVGMYGWLSGILIASIFINSFIYIMPIAIAIGILLWPDTGKGVTNTSHDWKAEQPIIVADNTWKYAYIFFLICISCAVVRFSYTEKNLAEKILQLPFEHSVELNGLVVVPSEAGTNGSQFVMKGTLEKDKENTKSSIIKFQIRDSSGGNYDYGDVVRVSGVIEKPEPFETTTGGMFDYEMYLKKDGILGIVKAKSIAVVAKKKGNPILRALISFEGNLEDIIKTTIPGMQGSLASGVLLGDKQITKENRTEFVTTGTTHIIALSGYNVSIVANFFRQLFSFLPFAGALAAGGFSIILFVVMTGLQSSAVRAGIMGCIVLFAKAKGRNADIGTVLLLAAVSMTILNPYTLYYDVSAELSFIATVGVIYFSPRVAHWFMWLPKEKFGLPWREIATGTIGTQLFVLPFILYKTGVLSLISPITNIAVLPFVPYLMAFTTIVALVGSVYLPLALPFAKIAAVNSGILLSLIHYSTKIPLAAVPLVTPLWAMALMYIFLIWKFDPFGIQVQHHRSV